MKGVDSFLYLLVVAFVIIIVFSLFSGSNFSPQSGSQFAVIEEFSLGKVGVAEDFASNTIVLGDLKVGETQEELLREVKEMDISQGVSGGVYEDLVISVSEAYLEIGKGAKLRFSVLESNPIGKLKITWNGKEIYNSVPSGLTEFSIGKDLVKGENNVKIEAEGPGMQFWATTSYTVKNFRVYALTGPQKVVPFQLLSSELQNFDRGEVSFFGSGTGRLDIKVNGVDFYSDVPIGSTTATFDLTNVPIKVGNNVLSFVSSDSNTLSGASFKIYSVGNQMTKLRKFNLDNTSFTKGRIDFTIDSFIKSGILEIRLNGNSLDLQIVQKGENTVYFKPETVKSGENTIEFSGSGAWDINSVKIGYEV